jgi:adenylate kinase family enzyme
LAGNDREIARLKKRIVILGCAGSGKTTLAQQLGKVTSAPVICLDAIWQSGWEQNDVPEFRRLVQQAHAGDAWISDGNFALATFDLRLPGATLIIWLERSNLYCAWRATTRVFKRGEAHRLGNLAKVLAFIWRFDRINRPRIEAARISHAPEVPVRRLMNSSEIAVFLASVAEGAHRQSQTIPLPTLGLH